METTWNQNLSKFTLLITEDVDSSSNISQLKVDTFSRYEEEKKIHVDLGATVSREKF